MVTKERKSILVITLSNIGDVILTTPVITSLRATFPHARLTVVVGPKSAGLLEGSRQIDRILIYDKWAGWSHKLRLVRSLREEFYEYVVDLRNSALPFLVRAHRRSPLFRPFHTMSARDRHLEILRMMKLPNHPLSLFDFFSEEEEISLFKKLKNRGVDSDRGWVVIAPGAGSETKRWRIEGFCEVITCLLGTSSLNVMAVGDLREVPLCERLSQINPKRVVNLAGGTTLRELAALVSHARLVLTNDSAVMHLGYELQRPVVALFGPSDPKRYGRENEIWRIVREFQPGGLENLSSEKILDACEELLNGIQVGKNG